MSQHDPQAEWEREKADYEERKEEREVMSDPLPSLALRALRDEWLHTAIAVWTVAPGEAASFRECAKALDPLILRCEALERELDAARQENALLKRSLTMLCKEG